MAAMEIDVSRLQTPPLFEKRRARKLPRTPEIERKQYLDLWDLSVWEEDDSSKSERPSAIDDIMRRSSVISKKEENDENEPPATDKERAADIEIAIKWIRQELVRLLLSLLLVCNRIAVMSCYLHVFLIVHFTLSFYSVDSQPCEIKIENCCDSLPPSETAFST